MTVRARDGFDRINAAVAAAVWLLIVVVYSLTKAPTLSLWDCGEFIAASSILGIPHPPGTPLYVIVARVFNLLPLDADIAARVNYLSVLCSSVAAVFGYLIGVRLLRYWFTERDSVVSRILTYGGAACGAFFLAFGQTQWINSVEAEVYGMSMMLFLCILWLTLRHFESRGESRRARLAMAIVYLSFLGIGAHMTTFMILPVAAVVLILKPNTPRHVWYLFAVFFLAELYLIFTLSSRPGEVPYYIPITIVTVFYIFYALSFERIPRPLLITGAGMLLACLPILNAFTAKPTELLTVVSLVAFGGVAAYAVWLLLQYQRARTAKDVTDEHRQAAIASLFVLTAVVMTLLLMSGIRGYGVFLVLSALLLIGFGALVWRHVNWPMVIALAGVSLVIIGIREWVIGSALAAAVLVFAGLRFNWRGWRTALLVVVMAVLGFSIHTFIPIRSSLHPYINENDPGRSLETTINFLERKQYGSQGMVERMFERRAEWTNAFGNHARMGFWGFFNEQYGLSGVRFLILFVLGAFGTWEICRRRPELGTVVIILLMVTTVGLVLYMNFADGTRRDPVTGGDYLEVRDRDYFFTPGFMMFGLLIGLGVSGIVQYVRDMLRRSSPGFRGTVVACAMVLYLLPVYALAGNYHVCDRTGNYVPYDYAYNLLISADENAVLFTSGDNDTFTLWCLQETFGVRKDVRNVNLSLANTDWYIRQIRDQMGLNLSWTDAQIDSLRPFRTSDGRVFRIQDQVIDELVRRNWGKVPINFSATCSAGSRKLSGRPVDSLLELRGLAYRLTDSLIGMRVDNDRSMELLFGDDGFQFRRWNDPTVHHDEATERTVRAMSTHLMAMIDALDRADRREDAMRVAEYMNEHLPMTDRRLGMLADYYSAEGRVADIERLIAEYDARDSLGLQLFLARAYRNCDQGPRAEAMLKEILQHNPGYRPALDELMAHYVVVGDVAGMGEALDTWLVHNPNDQQVRKARQMFIEQLEAMQESPPADRQ